MSLCLLADIGGTNGRFSLFDGNKLTQFKSYPCADFKSFSALIAHYLKQIEGPKPSRAVFAVATHVSADTIEFTNLPWVFSVKEIARTHQFEYLKIINDFTAVSLAVPLMKSEQLVQLGGKENQLPMAKAVLGAGTGLGVSGLLPYKDVWVPIQGQGGHIECASGTPFEDEIFAIIRQQQFYISAENLLSGSGLLRLYHAIALIYGVPAQDYSPADIVSQGSSGKDTNCEKVLDTFCCILGAVAGNLALNLGARSGVYIGGGVVNHMLDYLIQHSSFRQRFEQKGCMTSYMQDIPVYVITEPNVGMIGALAARQTAYDGIGISYSG